jgi:probable HAF family extracellular repeat protein
MSRTLAQDKPLWRTLLLAGVLAGVSLVAPAGTGAFTYTFTTIDVPGATYTEAFGINDSGHITGYCGSANCNFIDVGGSFTLVYVFGEFLGINNSDNIVGIYFGTNHSSFLYANGSFTTIEVPGVTITEAFGINDSGDIVGSYRDNMGMTHGFLYSNGKFTTLDFPGASVTVAYDINNLGTIVGYADGRGFLYANGSFTTIPGFSAIYGINDNGDMVGDDGVIYVGGTLTKVNVPGIPSPNVLEARGINNAGIIVGLYQGNDTALHGFMATPASTPFATFTATLELKFGPRIDDAFDLKSSFTLGTASSRINPPIEDVTLTLTGGTGAFTATIPVGSFTKDKKGRFTFTGQVDGVKLDATLTPLGGQHYAFTAEGKHADLSGIANPVTVTLTIGYDSGRTIVTTKLNDEHDKG